MPGPHLVYDFLTTVPNSVVELIHPKTMPVILPPTKSGTGGCGYRGRSEATQPHCHDALVMRGGCR